MTYDNEYDAIQEERKAVREKFFDLIKEIKRDMEVIESGEIVGQNAIVDRHSNNSDKMRDIYKDWIHHSGKAREEREEREENG